jgi:hypothetical protein
MKILALFFPINADLLRGAGEELIHNATSKSSKNHRFSRAEKVPVPLISAAEI